MILAIAIAIAIAIAKAKAEKMINKGKKLNKTA